MDLLKWTNKIGSNIKKGVSEFFGGTSDIQLWPQKNNIAEFSVAVPGLSKKDIDISIDNDYLIISSKKQYQNEYNDGAWKRKEYGYAAFRKMYPLPENADPDKIKAKMDNGMLHVTIGGMSKPISHRKTIKVA